MAERFSLQWRSRLVRCGCCVICFLHSGQPAGSVRTHTWSELSKHQNATCRDIALPSSCFLQIAGRYLGRWGQNGNGDDGVGVGDMSEASGSEKVEGKVDGSVADRKKVSGKKKRKKGEKKLLEEEEEEESYRKKLKKMSKKEKGSSKVGGPEEGQQGGGKPKASSLEVKLEEKKAKAERKEEKKMKKKKKEEEERDGQLNDAESGEKVGAPKDSTKKAKKKKDKNKTKHTGLEVHDVEAKKSKGSKEIKIKSKDGKKKSKDDKKKSKGEKKKSKDGKSKEGKMKQAIPGVFQEQRTSVGLYGG